MGFNLGFWMFFMCCWLCERETGLLRRESKPLAQQFIIDDEHSPFLPASSHQENRQVTATVTSTANLHEKENKNKVIACRAHTQQAKQRSKYPLRERNDKFYHNKLTLISLQCESRNSLAASVSKIFPIPKREAPKTLWEFINIRKKKMLY